MEEGRENVTLELFLARHGESMGNVGIPAGANGDHGDDPPLTEKGERQAALLGELCSRVPFDAVLASGLTRAVQTAAAIALRQPGGAAVQVHPLFTECGVAADYGVKTMAEIRSFCSFAEPAPGADPAESFVYAAGAEDDPARFRRAGEALTYLRRRFSHGERVFVAGHGAFNTVFLFAALGFAAAPAFDLAICNTGLSKLVFYAPGTGPYGADTHLIFHNDHAHLAAGGDCSFLFALK